MLLNILKKYHYRLHVILSLCQHFLKQS